MSETHELWCERGGADGPILLFLHGLGANAAVWDGLKPILAERWPGRWLMPDFRGHGRSFHRAPYGFGIHAADVAALVPPGAPVIAVGHSMGGVVAIALATGLFGIDVRAIVAFNVKVGWTDEERVKAQAVAQTPAKLFDSRDEAIDRYLKVSGLKGLLDPASPAAAVGIAEQNGQFRLAADPRTNDLGHADYAQMARTLTVPIHLLCGEKDRVANPEGMGRLGAEVRVLPGLGHNLQVENPRAFWDAIAPALGAA